MKMVKILAAALAVGLALAGCSGGGASSTAGSSDGTQAPATSPENTAAPADGKVYKIGFATCNLNDIFQTYLADALKADCEAASDLEVSVEDAQEDVVRQQDQVNSLISKGVDALIVVPVDTSAMEPITQAAKEAGIPLCYVNRNPYSGQETQMPENVFYVGSQEIVAGKMQAEFIGEKAGGKGGVAILQGILNNEGTVKRTEGNIAVLNEKYPEMKVLAQESGNWQRDQGMNITENWITAYGDSLNLIIANNDQMALGAILALEAATRTDVIVIGMDGIPDALQAIKDGKLAASVFQDAAGQGHGAVDVIQKALHGETQDSVLWIDYQLITPENVDDFITQ